MKLSLFEISKELEIEFDNSLDCQINNIKIDSRKVVDGDVFVAIKGESFDGHDFVSQAFENGAVAAIVEKNIENFDNSKVLFKVDNCIDAMQKIAAFYRSKFDIKVIGVTGSVGKSTVKEMLASIFSKEFRVSKSFGNSNGQIGLPLSVFNITDEIQIVVLEMGISEIGEMSKLAQIAKPDFAIINNIGTSHLGNFGTLETTVHEKCQISSCSDCKLYVNGDNLQLSNYLKDRENVVYFGLSEDFPYRAENLCTLGKETEFILVTDSCKELIRIPCIGIHNVYNALAAISLAMDFGIHINDIKQGLSEFIPLPRRQDIIELNNCTLVDDSYNASLDSVKASIGFLNSIESKGRNIALIADILELGSYSREIHYDLGKFIASSQIDLLVTVGNYSSFINEGVKSICPDFDSIHFATNDEAFDYLCNIIKDEDKILIKGSNGMKVDEIVSKLIDKFGLKNEKS